MYTYFNNHTKRALQVLSGGLVVGLSWLLTTTVAVANSFSFTKIADTKSDFVNILNSAAINDSGTVVFIAGQNRSVDEQAYTIGGNQELVYTSDGNMLTEIINLNDLPPLFNTPISTSSQYPPVVYYSFGSISINNNGSVAFLAEETRESARPLTNSLLIVSQNGSLSTRATSSDNLLYSYVTPTLAVNDLNEVAYLRRTNRVASFITSDLILTQENQPDITIATGAYTPPPYNSTVVTPEKPFSAIADLALNNTGEVVFAATDQSTGTSGIYTSNGGEFTKILEASASGVGVNDQGDIVIVSGDAIYELDSGSNNPCAIADTSSSFTSFTAAGINNNDQVAFIATFGSGQKGIFTGSDLIKDKVIATGDSFAGSTVVDLNFLRSGLNNNGQIAFYVSLADGTKGIFRASPSGTETSEQPPLTSDPDGN